jgi:CRISPR/Cas system-associated exonuclease Cas4 (RecB family)
MHDRMKDDVRGNEELRRILEDDKITVKEMGGWECAKCHY